MEIKFRKDSLENIVSKYSTFTYSEEEQTIHDEKRKHFRQYFDSNFIKKAKIEDYFQGHGKKEGCLTYELEWGTMELGSIRGGSVYKFGYEQDFEKIKNLILEILNFKDNISEFYNDDGSLTDSVQRLCEHTREIKGLKSGRTSVGKLLSIYYPNSFVYIFTDQDLFLKKILSDYSPESIGIELFLNNNFLLLKVKEYLLQNLPIDKTETFLNDKFGKLLYCKSSKTLGPNSV
jgi:hypothetical protein